MKKILVLILAAGTLSSVSAQQHQKDDRYEQRGGTYGNSNNREVYAHNDRNDNYSYNIEQRDAEMKRINREIDGQIWSVKNDRRVRWQDKNRQIAMLERERDQRIRELSSYFNDNRNNRYDDRVANNNRRKF